MLYAVILVLAVWVLVQHRRIDALNKRIELLAMRVRALAQDREPLLLDTPLPAAAANEETGADGGRFARAAPWISVVVLLALYGGCGYALTQASLTPALATLTAASMLAVLFAAVASGDGQAPARAIASLALYLSSAVLIWFWPMAATAPGLSVEAVALAAVFHVALAGYGARRRWTHVSVLAALAVAMVLGVGGYFRLRAEASDWSAHTSAIVVAVALCAAAVFARPNRHERGTAAFAGAFGAGALLALAAFARWETSGAYVPLLLGVALLVAATLRSQRDAPSRPRDWALAWWAGSASGLALLLAHVLLPSPAWGVATAGLALSFAAILGRTGWPIFGVAALASAAVALGHAISNPPAAPLAWSLAEPAAAAGVLFVAAHEAKHRPWARDGLWAMAWLAVLITLFAAIGRLGAGDPLLQTALQALALMCVGQLAAAPGAAGGVLQRGLGPGLLLAGFVTALGGAGWTFNPWWGETPAAVGGVGVLNVLALAFAAPALLAFLAAARWMDSAPRFARACLTLACAFVVMWAVLEVRRSFHGAAMASAPASWAEAAAYGLILVIAVLGLATDAGRSRIVAAAGLATRALRLPFFSRPLRS